MVRTGILIVCICSSIIITGGSFLLVVSISQAYASQYSTLVGHSNLWNSSKCHLEDYIIPDDELQHFKDTVESIWDMIRNMTHIDQMRNTTTMCNTINEEKDNYKYTLMEDSCDKLRRSSLRINEFREDFLHAEIIVSLDPELILNVNITRPDDPSRLIKKFSFAPRNVILSITTELDNSSTESFTPPKYINFDYTTTVTNYEIIDPEPPAEHLIKKFKELIQSTVEHNLSNELVRSKLLDHFLKLQLKIYCIPSDMYGVPYYMKKFHEVTIDSIDWKMNNVTIIGWPNFQTIKIAYLENSIKIQLEMTNSCIRIMANANNSVTKIENGYKINQTLITLDANKSEINQLNVTFVGFESSPKNSIVSDDLVKKALEKSIEVVMLKPPNFPD